MIGKMKSIFPLSAGLGMAGCSSMTDLYEKEVNSELAKTMGVPERQSDMGRVPPQAVP